MSEDDFAPRPDPNMVVSKSYWEKLKGIVKKNPKGKPLDEQGRFYPDPTPIAPPIGYKPEESMFDRVREAVRREISAQADADGFESFEDANDFDVDYDPEPFSEYEIIVEQGAPDAPYTAPDPEAVLSPKVGPTGDPPKPPEVKDPKGPEPK